MKPPIYSDICSKGYKSLDFYSLTQFAANKKYLEKYGAPSKHVAGPVHLVGPELCALSPLSPRKKHLHGRFHLVRLATYPHVRNLPPANIRRNVPAQPPQADNTIPVDNGVGFQTHP